MSLIRLRSPGHSSRHERGTALIMALVFLILLTIIGLASMSVVTLEEKMAGNLKESNLAFQAAESALRDGEADVFANISAAAGFNAACTNGLCWPAPGGTPPVWRTVDWSDSSTTSRRFGQVTGAAGLAGVKSQPRYIIESIIASANPKAGESLSGASTGEVVSQGEFFRITARGSSATGTGQTLVQSTFRK
jgi:type IV pilus assembly protein PilX